MAQIQQKLENFKKEGLTDAAARMAMEAELYASKNDIVKAKDCYNQASQLINEQMAYYK